jgi:hypothetical protein
MDMRRFTFAMLSCVFLVIISSIVEADVGVEDDTDKRIKPIWAEHPYNQFVQILGNHGNTTVFCTGQYVGPDLILTALHCRGDIATEAINVINGKEFSLEFIGGGNNYNEQDWGLFRVAAPTPDRLATRWLRVLPPSSDSNGTVTSVGFGGLRKLENWEIPVIRERYTVYLKYIRENIEKIKGLNESNIDFWDAHTQIDPNFARFFSLWLARNQGPRIVSLPLFEDMSTLKAHQDCHITGTNKDGFLQHDCHVWQGNSGGALIRGSLIYGIYKGGHHRIGMGYPEKQTLSMQAIAVKPMHFYDAVQNALRESETVHISQKQNKTKSFEMPSMPKNVIFIDRPWKH